MHTCCGYDTLDRGAQSDFGKRQLRPSGTDALCGVVARERDLRSERGAELARLPSINTLQEVLSPSLAWRQAAPFEI